MTVTKSYISIFEFDLGGKLEVLPNYKDYEKTVDLWLLYEPSGYVLTLRADGKYKRAPGDGSGKHQWKPLKISKSKVAPKQKTA